MATPGDSEYKGPVAEAWGRPIDQLAKTVDQHLRNAQGIPGDIDKNVRGAIGDILGLNKSKPKKKKSSSLPQYTKRVKPKAKSKPRKQLGRAKGMTKKQKASVDKKRKAVNKHKNAAKQDAKATRRINRKLKRQGSPVRVKETRASGGGTGSGKLNRKV